MSFRITYGFTANKQLEHPLHEMLHTKGNISFCKKVVKLVSELYRVEIELERFKYQVALKFAQKEKNGKLKKCDVLNPDGSEGKGYVFATKKNREQYDVLVIKKMGEEVSINAEKLNGSYLISNGGITPRNYEALEQLIK